jgi:hypothetical protein
MAKIVLHTTIQFQRNTYKKGETMEIAEKDIAILSPYGKIIEEEQPKKTVKKVRKG